MSAYQGHKNWNHWNVSLWICNDEGLYRMARRYALRGNRRARAAEMLADLRSLGITHTPDGAPYSISSIYAAIQEI